MIRMFSALSAIVFLLVGILIGGTLFSETEQRSVLALHHCEHCLSEKELLGLIGSVIVQKTPHLLPIVMETDRTVVIEHPLKQAELHYVVIPKKDIRSPSSITEEDRDYLTDAFLVMRSLIEKDHMENYRITTNGPTLQQVNYLHFHLTGIRGKP